MQKYVNISIRILGSEAGTVNRKRYKLALSRTERRNRNGTFDNAGRLPESKRPHQLVYTGALTSETLYKILEVLYTEKEAKWVALLPVRPFTVKKAAKIWQTSEFKAERLLDHLCEKALLVDSYHNGVRKFRMPPPMAGFIEFALMRTRGDIDQHYLGELYYQYMNVEEDFIKDLFFATETKLGRVYVQEPVLGQ